AAVIRRAPPSHFRRAAKGRAGGGEGRAAPGGGPAGAPPRAGARGGGARPPAPARGAPARAPRRPAGSRPPAPPRARRRCAGGRGVREGDVIRDVAGKTVSTPADVRKALADARAESKRSVLMRVKSGEATRFVAVSIAGA